MLIDHIHDDRRIFTDGRDWPREDIDPTFSGYSIGKWVDQNDVGKYDALEVETRFIKAPARSTVCCRPTRTIRASSRNASISTRPTATSCMTRSRSSIMPIHA